MELEKDVERYLKKEVSKKGGMCLKWTSTVKGVPDQIVLCPNGDTVFVEVKKSDGKLRPTQVKFHQKLVDLKQTIFTVNSKQKIDGLLKDLQRIGCFKK